MIVLILSFAVSILTGFCIPFLISRDKIISGKYFHLMLWPSVGLGLGLSSTAFFLWLSILKRPGREFLYFETVVLLSLMLWAHRKYRNLPETEHSGDSSWLYRPPLSMRLLSCSFFILLSSSFLSLLLVSLGNLHGRWDAWAIWNLRARFIYRSGTHLTETFSGLLDWSHPDYPLLIPGLIAKNWTYIGSETVLVPILFSILFCLLTVLLLVSSLSALGKKHHAYLAGTALLGSFNFFEFGAAQYADIPLSFYILAGFVLFAYHDFSGSDSRHPVVIAGILTGLALWTKNEGLLYMLALLAGRGAAALGEKKIKAFRLDMWALFKGLLPVLSVWIFFKWKFAPGNDLFSAENLGPMFSRLTEWRRYWQVAKLYFLELIRLENGLLILLCLFLLFMGMEKFWKIKYKALSGVTTLVLIGLAYFFVFILTPYNLNWHMDTALKRLFFHIWPSVLFFLFLSMNLNIFHKKEPGPVYSGRKSQGFPINSAINKNSTDPDTDSAPSQKTRLSVFQLNTRANFRRSGHD